MNIHEYQAKEVLHKFNVPVPKGFVATSAEEVKTQVSQLKSDVFVVKAQIHAGGRGKAGGVKLAKSVEEAQQFVKDMIGMTLVTHQTGPSGQQVRKVYVEEGSSIKKEYYLSLVIDPKLSRPIFIFSSEGGMDIEEVAKNSPAKIVKFDIDPATSFDSSKLSSSFHLSPEQIEKISNIAKKYMMRLLQLMRAKLKLIHWLKQILEILLRSMQKLISMIMLYIVTQKLWNFVIMMRK